MCPVPGSAWLPEEQDATVGGLASRLRFDRLTRTAWDHILTTVTRADTPRYCGCLAAYLLS